MLKKFVLPAIITMLIVSFWGCKSGSSPGSGDDPFLGPDSPMSYQPPPDSAVINEELQKAYQDSLDEQKFALMAKAIIASMLEGESDQTSLNFFDVIPSCLKDRINDDYVSWICGAVANRYSQHGYVSFDRINYDLRSRVFENNENIRPDEPYSDHYFSQPGRQMLLKAGNTILDKFLIIAYREYKVDILYDLLLWDIRLSHQEKPKPGLIDASLATLKRNLKVWEPMPEEDAKLKEEAIYLNWSTYSSNQILQTNLKILREKGYPEFSNEWPYAENWLFRRQNRQEIIDVSKDFAVALETISEYLKKQ